MSITVGLIYGTIYRHRKICDFGLKSSVRGPKSSSKVPSEARPGALGAWLGAFCVNHMKDMMNCRNMVKLKVKFGENDKNGSR